MLFLKRWVNLKPPLALSINKEPPTSRLSGRMGSYRYGKLIFYLVGKYPGIITIDLTCQILMQCLRYVPLTLNLYINRDFRRVYKRIWQYISRGHLKTSPTDASHLQIFLVRLHRSLRKKGRLYTEKYGDYVFRLLDFAEMSKGALLPDFIVADHCIVPTTIGKIKERTGYQEKTISRAFTGLKAMGLLGKENNRHVLRGDSKQLFYFFEYSKECKLKWIRRVRRYLKCFKLAEKSLTPREISEKMKVSIGTIYTWKKGNMPKLKLQTGELFVKQRLIHSAELEIWKKKGVLLTEANK